MVYCRGIIIKLSTETSYVAAPATQVIDTDTAENEAMEADDSNIEALDAEIKSAEAEENSLDDQLDELEALTF